MWRHGVIINRADPLFGEAHFGAGVRDAMCLTKTGIFLFCRCDYWRVRSKRFAKKASIAVAIVRATCVCHPADFISFWSSALLM
jgi:hypothetical protein